MAKAWRCAQGRTRQSQGAMQLAGWFTRSSMTRCWQAAAAEADPTAVARLCAEGEEAAHFIRTYVVQARLNERGNYGAWPRCMQVVGRQQVAKSSLWRRAPKSAVLMSCFFSCIYAKPLGCMATCLSSSIQALHYMCCAPQGGQPSAH